MPEVEDMAPDFELKSHFVKDAATREYPDYGEQYEPPRVKN